MLVQGLCLTLKFFGVRSSFSVFSLQYLEKRRLPMSLYVMFLLFLVTSYTHLISQYCTKLICVKSTGKNGFFRLVANLPYLSFKKFSLFVTSWTWFGTYRINYSHGSRKTQVNQVNGSGESWKVPTGLFSFNLILVVAVSRKFFAKVIIHFHRMRFFVLDWTQLCASEKKRNFKKRINLELSCGSSCSVHFRFMLLMKLTIIKSKD